MDSVFLLSPEARSRFLPSAARLLRCSYICLWSSLHRPSSIFLICKDGWHHEEDSGCSSSGASSSKRLFDAYRSSLCNFQYCSCVPGLAYKSSLPYIELNDCDLMDLASMRVQRQFYQTAVFLRCTSGEIEFGFTTSISYANMHINVQKVFSEEFIQQSLQLGEEIANKQTQRGDQQQLLPVQLLHSRPPTSSSTSSLQSLSVESILDSNSSLPHPVFSTMKAYSRYQNLLLPSPASDNAVVARAMLAVISSTCSSSATTTPKLTRSSPSSSKQKQTPFGAFMPYTAIFAAKSADITPRLHGQKMIKMVIDLLKRMNMTSMISKSRPTTSNQLHHMISERRRRKKLNESFDALRILLPQGSKKDKASVLASAKNYLNSLKAQISKLEERNRLLESSTKLHQTQDCKEIKLDSNERVQVHIGRPSASTSETQQINLIVLVREECNMIDVVRHVLECLKRKGDTALVAVEMEASTRSPQTNVFIRASIILQVKASDFNESSLEEAVIEAVNNVLPRSANPTT
ncbi:hypothetical protein Cni_G17819 [Canna indica]|uniref:BHLH domain-containing protein n=1 Tax=Canna indica TaxID=4628 RepID=A0AAQ3QDV6_9LILI|nr:hypothetical protein Cni_G17819 [Canna indica]